MSLPQNDKSITGPDDDENVDGSDVVMPAIDDAELDAFQAYCFETEAAVLSAALDDMPADFRPARNYAEKNYVEGDGSEGDIFAFACK